MYQNYEHLSTSAFNTALTTQCILLSKQLRALQKEINADYLYIATLDAQKIVHTITVLHHAGKIDNFSYELKKSPCEKLENASTDTINIALQSHYPYAPVSKITHAHSYLGAPLLSRTGQLAGVVVALYAQPISVPTHYKNALLNFAHYTELFVKNSQLKDQLNSQRSLFSAIETMSHVGAWEYKIITNEFYLSPEIYKIFGLKQSASITIKDINAHCATHNKKRMNSLFKRLTSYGESYSADFEFSDAQGNKKWLRTNGQPLKNDQQQIVSVYGAIEDITLARNLIASVEDEKNRLEAILDNLNDGVITIDEQGTIVHANTTALHMFQYSEKEMLGLAISQLMPEPYASKHSTYMAHYAQTGEAKIIGLGRQLPACKKDGTTFQMELSLTTTTNKGQVQYIGVVRDISEKLKAQDTIYNLAYSDPITGLKNKRWFERECRSLLQRAAFNNGFIYVGLLDIDKLAQFNFKYGLEAGNEALFLTAQKLLKYTSDTLKIYKNDIDSFLIISVNPNNTLNDLMQQQPKIDEKILALDNFTHRISGFNIVLSGSLGSAIFNAKSDSFESLLNKLEYAQKQAKQLAPFGYYFADINALKRYERTNKIRHLLINVDQSNELKLVLQPQYIDGKTFHSSEALLRWESKELGIISPAEFIPIAEESETIIKIGDWVINNACKLLHEIDLHDKETRIAINISAKQIVAANFKQKLIANINKWQVSAHNLILELTETTLVSDIELVKTTMLELNEMGFRFSIDDFGTGYSSLSYLKALPIAELKIDKFFIDGITDTQDASSRTIVNMIIDMAKALGVNSVAEGVEEHAQYTYLKQRGCDLFQGYLFSKPLSVSQWLKRVK